MKKVKLLIVLLFLIISLISGQTIINPDKPVKGKWDFQLKKMWEIGGSGDKDFGRIQNIEVSDDGRVFVLDSKIQKIFIFNKDGKFLSEFGKMGEGPGEFKNFRMGDQLFVIKDDLIFIDRGRVLYFTLDGKFKKTVNIPASIRPRGFISRDVLISAPLMVMDPSQKVHNIKSYNLLNKTEDVISTFKPFDKASANKESGGRRMMVGIIIGSITPLMNIAYKNGNLFFGMSDNYKITKRDLKKNKENHFLIKGRLQKKVSKKFFDNFSKRLKQIPPEMKKKILDGLPKKASFFQRIIASDNGLVYVFVSDPDNNALQMIDVFSNDGKFLYSTVIKLEEGENLSNIQIYKNNLLFSFEDEEGNIKLAKYQIEQPGV